MQPGLLPDGWPVSPLTAQTMACGADLVPILVDEDHQPLDVGDTRYPFPPKIRTAIITRDKGCTYPGCGAPAPWCDVHHLIRFRYGGSTSVDNGALLCGRHHRYVHALGLTGRVTHATGPATSLGPPAHQLDRHHGHDRRHGATRGQHRTTQTRRQP